MEPDENQPPWAFIRIQAESDQQMEAYLGLLWEIVECTSGYVGVFDEEAPPGELAVDLCSGLASEDELGQIWSRVQGGEEVMFAWKAVQGPSYTPRRCQTLMMNIMSRLRPPHRGNEHHAGNGE